MGMARRGANAGHIPIFRGRLGFLRWLFEFGLVLRFGSGFCRFFSTEFNP